MTREHLIATLKGALKSLTVWAAGVIALLPEALPLIRDNFATVAPYIPADKQAGVLRLIALAMLLLRLRTTTSLAAKGGTTEPKP